MRFQGSESRQERTRQVETLMETVAVAHEIIRQGVPADVEAAAELLRDEAVRAARRVEAAA